MVAARLAAWTRQPSYDEGTRQATLEGKNDAARKRGGREKGVKEQEKSGKRRGSFSWSRKMNLAPFRFPSPAGLRGMLLAASLVLALSGTEGAQAVAQV